MEYFVGIALALPVSLFAALVGFDRDRALYPAVMVVIASYCVPFAVMSGSADAVSLELVALSLFVLVSVIGFRTNL